MSTEQADPEQREARDRHARADPLSRRQRDVREAGDHDREDADTRRGGRLHERQRRQRERTDVEEPADHLGSEAREPAPIAQKRGQRRERPPKRERRHLRGNAVLEQIPQVEETGRDDRNRQREPDLHQPSPTSLERGRERPSRHRPQKRLFPATLASSPPGERARQPCGGLHGGKDLASTEQN